MSGLVESAKAALDAVVADSSSISELYEDLAAWLDDVRETSGAARESTGPFDLGALSVHAVARMARVIYGEKQCVMVSLVELEDSVFLSLRVAKDAVRLYFSNEDLWSISENRVELYPFNPYAIYDPDEPLAEVFAASEGDLECELVMNKEPRLLRGKEALELARHLAQLLSAPRLHVSDVAETTCLSDPSQTIESISFLRLLAGLPTIYEASGAVYAQPEQAERVKSKARARGDETDEETKLRIADDVRSYLRGEHADDPSYCEKMNDFAEDFRYSLSRDEQLGVSHLFWDLA